MYCYHCMKKIVHAGYCEDCASLAPKETVAHHLAPGTILNNKYYIGNVLGEGGFGITYIARDLTLDITVAVKEYFPYGYAYRDRDVSAAVTVTTESQRDVFLKGRAHFLEEARKIAMFLGSPGIVSVRDYFEANDTAYIIMEYLDGRDLSAELADAGPFPAKRMFEMMLPIMDSLQKIHAAGLIHRDISPSNIMLLSDGMLKLMDFGNARYFINNEKEFSITLKPGYAPEEQYRADGDQGPWTDVYALCATIYKCITGVKPVNALDRIPKDGLVAPSKLTEISPALESVLLYGMKPNSEERCRSMTELADRTRKALAQASSELPPSALGEPKQDRDDGDITMAGVQTDPHKTAPPTGSGGSPSPKNAVNVAPAPPKKPVEPPQEKKSPALVAIILALVVALVAGIGVIAFLLKGKNNDPEPENAPVAAAETEKKEEADDAEARPVQTAPQTEAPTVPKTEAPSAPPQTETAVQVDDAVAFISAVASSTLPSQGGYTYFAQNAMMKDNNCWVEGAAGNGIGEWIRFELPTVQRLYGLSIVNGYVGTTEQYDHNGKIKSVKLEFSNGESATTDLIVYPAEQRTLTQVIEFNRPIETSFVKLTILDVSAGEVPDTCLTYIAPYLKS